MTEVLLLLLAYGFLLDWLLKKVDADVGRMPWVLRHRALARRRP